MIENLYEDDAMPHPELRSGMRTSHAVIAVLVVAAALCVLILDTRRQAKTPVWVEEYECMQIPTGRVVVFNEQYWECWLGYGVGEVHVAHGWPPPDPYPYLQP